MWDIESTGDGYYKVTSRISGLVMDVADCSPADSAYVIQWNYWAGDCQKWKIEEMGSGFYKLTAKHSNKVLDVRYASLSAGAQVWQWTSNDSDAQRWRLDRVSAQGARVAQETVAEQRMQVYPVPAGERASLVLITVLGRTIKTSEVALKQGWNQLRMKTTEVPAGLYLISVGRGTTRQTKQIIISH